MTLKGHGNNLPKNIKKVQKLKDVGIYDNSQLLVYRNEKSNKYYLATSHNTEVFVYYGAIKNDTPHFSYWTFDTNQEAETFCLKKLIEKQKKGYQKVEIDKSLETTINKISNTQKVETFDITKVKKKKTKKNSRFSNLIIN